MGFGPHLIAVVCTESVVIVVGDRRFNPVLLDRLGLEAETIETVMLARIETHCVEIQSFIDTWELSVFANNPFPSEQGEMK